MFIFSKIDKIFLWKIGLEINNRPGYYSNKCGTYIRTKLNEAIHKCFVILRFSNMYIIYTLLTTMLIVCNPYAMIHSNTVVFKLFSQRIP